jgi:hypothetical protein
LGVGKTELEFYIFEQDREDRTIYKVEDVYYHEQSEGITWITGAEFVLNVRPVGPSMGRGH